MTKTGPLLVTISEKSGSFWSILGIYFFWDHMEVLTSDHSGPKFAKISVTKGRGQKMPFWTHRLWRLVL